MVRSPLVDLLLEKAEVIRASCGAEMLNASHVAAAVVDYCSQAYTGICISDGKFQPIPFEEERLRLVYSKVVRLKGYLKNLLNRSEFTKAAVPFELTLCEKIAAGRSAHVISADTVFLCALIRLPEKAEKVIVGVGSEADIQERLAETDRGVYDFVLEGIDKVRLALDEKANTAKKMRDWKPAGKFAEPEVLPEMLFSQIELRERGNCLDLKLPGFFGKASLTLTVHQVGESWYLHDNGGAIRHLSNHLKDDAKLKRALKKVCHSGVIQKGRIVGSFSNAFLFFNYLQRLVFIAHADLFYTKAEKALYEKDRGVEYVPLKKAEPMNRELLLETLKKGIWVSYDENEGLRISFDTLFSLFSTHPSFVLELPEDGFIRICDGRFGQVEGEIFEAFYWDHEDLSLYTEFIRKFTDRFGAEFDGESVYLTEKTERYFSALCRFWNLAILLSELGGRIALPKLRQRREDV